MKTAVKNKGFIMKRLQPEERKGGFPEGLGGWGLYAELLAVTVN